MEQRRGPRNKPIYIYIYIYIHTYTYTHIYVYRKRDSQFIIIIFCKDTMNKGERKAFPKQDPRGTEYPCAKE